MVIWQVDRLLAYFLIAKLFAEPLALTDVGTSEPDATVDGVVNMDLSFREPLVS